MFLCTSRESLVLPYSGKENAPPLRKQALLSQSQVKYVEDIIVTRDTENLGVSRREVIQTIPNIGQASYYVQAENNLDDFIW